MQINSPFRANYEVFGIRDFRYFIAIRFVLIVASQIQFVVVGWHMYQLTRDPLSLGLIGLAGAVPALTVALYAGHLADRLDRRKIVTWTTAVLAIGATGLAIFTEALERGAIAPATWPLYAMVFLYGIGRGFIGPALSALVTNIVPRRLYSLSATWNSTAFQVGAVVGPALGGILAGRIGVRNCYLTSAALFLLAGLLLSLIRASARPLHQSTEGVLESIRGGIRFVFRSQVILAALSLDLFAVLFGGAVALLPIFADDILGVGAEGLGWLRAAPSVGALVTMLFLAHWPTRRHDGLWMLWSVGGFGVSIICFGLSQSFWLSMVCLAASGAFDAVSVIVRQTALQIMTPDELRGRVTAINQIFIGSSNEIGELESGIAAKLLGTVTAVVAGGCVTLSVVVITALKAPLLRSLELTEQFPESKEHREQDEQ